MALRAIKAIQSKYSWWTTNSCVCALAWLPILPGLCEEGDFCYLAAATCDKCIANCVQLVNVPVKSLGVEQSCFMQLSSLRETLSISVDAPCLRTLQAIDWREAMHCSQVWFVEESTCLCSLCFSIELMAEVSGTSWDGFSVHCYWVLSFPSEPSQSGFLNDW